MAPTRFGLDRFNKSRIWVSAITPFTRPSPLYWKSRFIRRGSLFSGEQFSSILLSQCIWKIVWLERWALVGGTLQEGDYFPVYIYIGIIREALLYRIMANLSNNYYKLTIYSIRVIHQNDIRIWFNKVCIYC